MMLSFEKKYEYIQKKLTQKNRITELFVLLAFFILLEPRYFFFVDGINTIFKYGVIIVSLILFFGYLLFEWKKWSKMTLLCILYHGYLCGLTLFTKGDFVEIVQDSLFFCSLCILTEYCLKYNPRFLYTKLLLLLACEMLINVPSIFMENGLYATSFAQTTNYFLGYKNQMINIILPTLMLGYLYVLSQGKGSRILLFCLFIISFITVVHVDSKASTLMVCLMVFPVFCLCNFSNVFNMVTYLAVNIISFVSIVLLQVQKKMGPFIEMIFPGRNTSFSGRDFIWQNTINLIKENPVWGYGVEEYSSLLVRYGMSGGYTFFTLHAHDRFLETMYRGGIVLLIIYVIMLCVSTYYLFKYRKLNASKIVAFSLFVYLVGMITEFYRYSYLFFPMMVIAENILLLQNSIDNDLKAYPLNKRRVLGIWPKRCGI